MSRLLSSVLAHYNTTGSAATHNRFQDTRLDDMRKIGFHVFEYDVQIPIVIGPHHIFNFDYILMLESLEVADFPEGSLCVNIAAKCL